MLFLIFQWCCPRVDLDLSALRTLNCKLAKELSFPEKLEVGGFEWPIDMLLFSVYDSLI